MLRCVCGQPLQAPFGRGEQVITCPQCGHATVVRNTGQPQQRLSSTRKEGYTTYILLGGAGLVVVGLIAGIITGSVYLTSWLSEQARQKAGSNPAPAPAPAEPAGPDLADPNALSNAPRPVPDPQPPANPSNDLAAPPEPAENPDGLDAVLGGGSEN